MAKKTISLNKKNSTFAVLISVIVLLSITCIISITYNFIGGFYYGRLVSFSKVLGEDEIVLINDDGVYSCSFSFGGTLVLNSNIKQNIYVQNGEKELYLRAKVTIDNNDGIGYAFGIVNWVSGVDGYIYLNQPVGSHEKVGPCRYVKINDDIKLESNLNYILSVVIEASDSPFEYEMI